jgi:sortase A
MRGRVHLLGTLLAVAGVLTLGWALLVWQWQDPFTALYTTWKQHQLASQYDKRARSFTTTISGPTVKAERASIAREAKLYRLRSKRGQVIGRLRVPRMSINMLLVNGTDHDTLKKGPGRDGRTFMPGENRLVYIAGHRTTYLAPFSHIDRLRRGDRVTIEVPYGTFIYAVTRHRIVKSTDLSVLRSPRHEVVELQACHPRFFASHRYIAYAKLLRVEPRGAKPYELTAQASGR